MSGKLLEDSYSQSARRAVDVYVQGATRLEPGDLHYSDEQRTDVVVEVEVDHKLVCRIDESTVHGARGAGMGDLWTQDENEHREHCSKLSGQALADYDVEGSLKRMVDLDGYGRHDDETYLGSYRRSALYNFTCETCKGDGKVRCRSCVGSGHESCTFCGGSGSTTQSSSHTDHNGHSSSHFESVSCMSCGGSGHQTCGGCHGMGTVTCRTCHGERTMTRTSTPQYHLLSRYDCVSVEPKDEGIEFALFKRTSHLSKLLGGVGVLRQRKVLADLISRRIGERVSIDVSFYRAKAKLEDFESGVTVYGRDFLMSDVGGLVERLVQPDLHLLQDAVQHIRGLDLFSVGYAHKCATVFMESEVHQEALKNCPEGALGSREYEDLSASVSRALSPQYLEDALKSLAQMHAKTLTEYSRFAWMIGAPVILYFLYWAVSNDYPWVALMGGTLMSWLTYIIAKGLAEGKTKKISKGVVLRFARHVVFI